MNLLAFLGKGVASAFPGTCLIHYAKLFVRIRWLVDSSIVDGSTLAGFNLILKTLDL